MSSTPAYDNAHHTSMSSTRMEGGASTLLALQQQQRRHETAQRAAAQSQSVGAEWGSEFINKFFPTIEETEGSFYNCRPDGMNSGLPNFGGGVDTFYARTSPHQHYTRDVGLEAIYCSAASSPFAAPTASVHQMAPQLMPLGGGKRSSVLPSFHSSNSNRQLLECPQVYSMPPMKRSVSKSKRRFCCC